MNEKIGWLVNDVKQNREEVSTNDSQRARRNYLRALSALYEFDLTNLREIVAKILVSNFEITGEWKFHELYPLMDETSRVTENGKIKLEVNKLPFLPLVAYTLKTFAQEIGSNIEIFSDHGWHAFCDSIKIRHRITHPKLDKEIEISDLELQIIDSGWEWWNRILKQLYIEEKESMKIVKHYSNLDRDQ